MTTKTEARQTVQDTPPKLHDSADSGADGLVGKCKPILFSAPMVRAIMNGTKTQTRRVVAASNSTVLGHSVTSKSKLWRELDWTGMAWRDQGPHELHSSKSQYLHVPVKYDPVEDGEDATRGRVYRVRCKLDIGDELWVRETHRVIRLKSEHELRINYRAGGEDMILKEDSPEYWDAARKLMAGDGETRGAYMGNWRPSIFLPRWASRITLEITDVRVERVQEITDKDCVAEGIERINDVPMNPLDFTACWKDYTGKIQPYFNRPYDCFHSLWASINGEESWTANPWTWVISFRRIGQ